MIRLLTLLIIVASLFSACKKDEVTEAVTTEQTTNEKNNTWIYNSMKHDYLFYKDMPALSSLDLKQDPEKFFPLLLSAQEKRSGYSFSYIEKNTTTKSTVASDATLSYGMEYMRYYFGGTLYAIRVLYVIPNSAAAKSGIKRGDWFSGVGGVGFNDVNTSVLLSGNAISLDKFILTYNSLGKLQLTKMGTVSLQAATMISDNPVFLDTVYTMSDNTKVGYFVYNQFSTGPNGFDDKTYDNKMKEVFARFKSKGIQKLIVDLRYNGGGYLSSCQLLSSMIAPTTILGDVMAYEEFNEIIAAERVASRESARETIAFLPPAGVETTNVDMKELYVICSEWTASASELVINALKAYIPVKLIGTTTVGKNMGSYEIKNDTYTMHPITIKIYNSKNESNYSSGFTPDYIVDESQDDLTTLQPLGDTQEIMINKALTAMGYNVTTRSAKTRSTIPFTVRGSSLSRKRTDLIMNR